MYIHFSSLNSLPNEINETKYFLNFSENSIVAEIEKDNFYLEIEKINFLIGTNNSGKSRFLRSLLKLNKSSNSFQILPEKERIENHINKLLGQKWLSELQKPYVKRTLSNYTSYQKEFNVLSNSITNKKLTAFDLIENTSQFKNLFSSNKLFYDDLIEAKNKYGSTDFNKLIEFSETINCIEKSVNFQIENKISEAIYIPILRSLKKSKNLTSESFDKTTIELYNLNQEREKIFTGLKFYDNVRDIRNSIKEERKGFEEFEKFLSKNFFNDKDVEIIANLKDSHVNIYIDGEERKAHDIGDGVQQLILLMFPIYTSKINSWILIEEPETHLHPGLQRIFIETLLNDKFLKLKNIKYFFTTHSNHFLDLSLQTNDISILQFQKESQEKFIIKNIKPNKETLDLLGVNNSSVLIANSSIWVEGPTDRKYISKFLKSFCEQNNLQHLKEDIDFAFFEYGGNLIAHYLFDKDFDKYYNEKDVKTSINAFASANKIYLLADNDNASGEKLLRGENLKKLSDNNEYFKYKNTDVVEIENLLPKEIIKSFLKTLVKKDLKKVDKIDFSQEDYKETRLGEFLFDLLIKNGFEESNFFKFKAKSGTLVNDYKLKLCDFLINDESKYQDIISNNNQLDELIKDLYNFIKPNY